VRKLREVCNRFERGSDNPHTFACLRADLAAWTKLADDAEQHARIRQALQHRKKHPDLAAIRDPDADAKLLAVEQDAWKRLGAGVAGVVEM
jgi:hypothetical protein